jgi:hypothetical protein
MRPGWNDRIHITEMMAGKGPNFLRRTSRRKARKDKLFVARLRGDIKRYPFLLCRDLITIKSSPDFDILQALTESHFVAKAVEIGVTDRERIGVIGHSHGGLMVANLLAHSESVEHVLYEQLQWFDEHVKNGRREIRIDTGG